MKISPLLRSFKCNTLIFLLFICFSPAFAWAGDAATVVFRSGQVVYINNGYKQLVEAMLALNQRSQDHRIVELNIEGGSFLLNVAEVNIICRDRCSSLEVIDVRDPARQNNRGNSGSR